MPRIDDFELQEQERSNWCWAAITASLVKFYSPESETRQCGIAHDELGLRCCEDAERNCNQVHRLQLPLERIGRLRGERRDAPISFEGIKREIDSGALVCARIGWRTGGGHFVVISGYKITPKMGNVVIIDDPKFGRASLTYEGFLSRYKRIGEWTHSYHLKRRTRNQAAS